LGRARSFIYASEMRTGPSTLRALLIHLAASLVASLSGCVSAPAPIAAGGRCTRTVECGPGLLCNMGLCTTDRTGFGMGMVPVLPMDAGPLDAFEAPDAAVEVEDAFTEPPDAHVLPGTDAWAPVAWVPDAFSPSAPDAWAPPPDASMPPSPDAHVPVPPDAFSEPDVFEAPDAAI
jgi:hypothetical protein